MQPQPEWLFFFFSGGSIGGSAGGGLFPLSGGRTSGTTGWRDCSVITGLFEKF